MKIDPGQMTAGQQHRRPWLAAVTHLLEAGQDERCDLHAEAQQVGFAAGGHAAKHVCGRHQRQRPAGHPQCSQGSLHFRRRVLCLWEKHFHRQLAACAAPQALTSAMCREHARQGAAVRLASVPWRTAAPGLVHVLCCLMGSRQLSQHRACYMAAARLKVQPGGYEPTCATQHVDVHPGWHHVAPSACQNGNAPAAEELLRIVRRPCHECLPLLLCSLYVPPAGVQLAYGN